MAIISNHTAKSISYRPILYCAPFQQITSQQPEVVIAAGDSALLTATIYIPRGAAADKNYLITWKAISTDHTLMDSTTISLTPINRISLQVLEPDIYLLSGKNEADVSLKCSNTGNISQKVTITVTDPLQPQKELTLSTLTVNSFSDTILHFRIRIPGALMANTRNQLRITGKNSNNDIITTLPVTIYNVSNQRNYAADQSLDGNVTGPGHTAAIYSRMTGSDYHYLEALAGGQANLTETKTLRYQADARYFTRSQTWMLTNTFINYQSPACDLTAGSIFRSYEMMLSGRGAVAVLTPDTLFKFEAGYVNGNYNLVSSFTGNNNEFYTPYNAYFLHTATHFSDALNGNAQFIFQQNPQELKDDILGGGSLGWQSQDGKHQMEGGAYTSYSTTQEYEHDGKNARGYAGTFNYTYIGKRWQGVSINYYSTPFYAGTRKGVLNLDQKIIFTPGGGQPWYIHYSQFGANPRYISPVYKGYYENYSLRTLELGTTKALNEHWQLGLKPYYYEEHTEYNNGFSTISPNLQSIRISGDLRYQGQNGQLFWITADIGFNKGNTTAYTNFFAFRIYSGLTYKHFLLNAFIQHGPYLAGEMNQYLLPGKKYQLISISPGYSGRLFRNRLFFQVFDYITYQSSFERLYNNLSVNTTYRLSSRLTLEAGYNRIYGGLGEQINGIDIGIRKQFGSSKAALTTNGTLDIFFFEDNNSNYLFDPGEHPARNVMVRINQEVFVTGNEGRITFKNLPNGPAKISILSAGGYFASDSIISVNGKTQIQIPLHKIGVIQGHVMLEKESLSYSTDESVAAITITAKDPTGRIFVARTNENGIFTLYAPSNTYTITVDPQGLPEKYQYIEPPQQITLTTSTPVKIGLRIQVQKRPVKVKKFGSSTAKN
ncbi:hypothetical protein DF182_07750 [Chitinophaga flava]|uniref:SD-repeat containing protein B domain-containing protein n=1 Tax=Chitinophaga flava TaxID=2259036 RepID=A0A365Y3K8_9BACT|nr:hypothetical protein DF182_07750 [Chitinophaga flava]